MASKSIRDSQRQRLYDAEAWAFEGWPPERVRDVSFQTGHPEFRTVAECQEYLDSVTESDTFRALGINLIVPIEVKDGRMRRRAGADRDGDIIRLPRWSRRRWSILHELAHIATSYYYGEIVPLPGGEPGDIDLEDKVASHGPEYAGVYLHLVGGVLGSDAYHALADSFAEHRVKVKHVSAPPHPPTEVEPDTPVTEPDTAKVPDEPCEPWYNACLYCGRELPKIAPRRRFCSDEHRYAFHNARRHDSSAPGREKVCVVCGRSFEAGNSLARYCSDACRQKAYRER